MGFNQSKNKMYKPNVQTTRRTKGSFAWQDTSFVRKPRKAKTRKAKAVKAKVAKVARPLKKENTMKDSFGVTINKPDLDWLERKLQQNRIFKQYQ